MRIIGIARAISLGLWLSAAAYANARAQSVDIPLQLVESSQGVRLVINVGIDGQQPRSYLFDTGSNIFNAYYSGGAFGSIAPNMGAPTAAYPNGLPTGVVYSYGDNTAGNSFTGNIVAVPSLAFYATPAGGSAVTLNATTPTGAQSNFLINAVYRHVDVETVNGQMQTTIYDVSQPLQSVAGGFGGVYGIFGAGNLAAILPGSAANSIPGVLNTTSVAIGGVLGQAVVPGTVSGYVIAANGQSLTGGLPSGTPTIQGSLVNGPQPNQCVLSSCGPSVMLGLTPALLAQFKPVDTMNAVPSGPNFPNSNAPSSAHFGIDMRVTLSAPGQTPISIYQRTLLDTGTSNTQIYNSSIDASGLGQYVPSGGYYDIRQGTTITASNPHRHGTTTTDTVYPTRPGNITSPYDVQVYSTNQNATYLGIDFFLQNSVLFNLQGQTVGYTPNFVTSTNIVTTSANPFVVGSGSVPLGLAGLISGEGGVSINGGGSATLSGANNYTGATTISGRGSFLALVGPGSIAASSGVSVSGGGAFDISGVTGGALIKSLSGDANGQVALGANILALSNANGTFQGVIQDGGTNGGAGGSLVLLGGNQVLTGANTYTGSTLIYGGRLEVDGSTASTDVIVNAGGMLSGNGTIGDPIINAGGTLAPGTASSIGTLTINGPLTFQQGSNYNIRVTPAANDFTQVNGAATINGGTVNVFAGTGAYQASNRFTVLSATNGVTGQFSGVTSNPFLTPSLSYDANDVFVSLAPNYSFARAALTRNQFGVANALAIGGLRNPDSPAILAFNTLSLAEANAGFDSVSGEGIAAADTAALQANQFFSGTMNDQAMLWLEGGGNPNAIVLTEPPPGALNYAPVTKSPIVVHDPLLPPVRTWSGWTSGFGADETVHGNASLGTAAQSAELYGGSMGIDYQVNPALLLGIAGGGSNSNFSVRSRATSGSVAGGHIGAYQVTSFDPFYAASAVSLSFFHNSETRSVMGIGPGETDRGNYNSIAFRTRLEAGRRFTEVYGATVAPFAALEIADLRSNGFSETPSLGTGAFALNVQGRDTASVPVYLGLRFETRLDAGYGIVLKPVLSLAYGHDFAPQRTLTSQFLNLPGSSFEADGASVARDFAQTKLGFELAFAPGAMAFANFDGAFSGRDQLYGGKGGIKLVW